MPIYDYQCQECEHKFTARCSVSKRKEQPCPRCGSRRVSQLFSSFNRGSSSTGRGCETFT